MKVTNNEFYRFLMKLNRELNVLYSYKTECNFREFYPKFSEIKENISNFRQKLTDKQHDIFRFSLEMEKLDKIKKDMGIL